LCTITLSIPGDGWILSQRDYEEVEVFAGDIRDSNGVLEAMKGIDKVFHLAALVSIPFSYHSPEAYVDTNIKGTLNVLQAARILDTSRVFITLRQKYTERLNMFP